MHSSSLHLLTSLLFIFIFFFPFTSPSSPANNLTFYGDALFSNNSIILTQNLNCSISSPSSSPFSGVGRAFYANPIHLLDSSTNTTSSFSSTFSFKITPSNSCPFGDGIAFLITSNPGSLNLSDGHMGLPDNSSNPQYSFLAVEFDTSFNPYLGDFNSNHVGIDDNTIFSNPSVDVIPIGIDLKSGKEMTAWIEYTDSEKTIRVWVGYDSHVRPSSPLLAAQIDLSKKFQEFMHVGFSASNGRGSTVHTVNQWRFKTSGLFHSSTLPMETVEQGDCLVCFPDDSHSNLENDHTDKRVHKMALGLGFSSGFIIFLFTILLVVCVWMTRRKRNTSRRCNRFQENYRGSKRFSLTEIRSATNGFRQSRIIGEGASATVYKASLPSCGLVAVKRFSHVNKKITSLCNPFNIEFATMVGCLRHENLVQLRGWCCERNELVLVYDYLPNGNLDEILHTNTTQLDSTKPFSNCMGIFVNLRNNAPKFLNWDHRVNIVLGVCSALTYLHEGCDRLIIHRAVKACNVMLDAEFNAKLGDYGLAEIYEPSRGARDTTLAACTMGYLAPEYIYSGVPTVKTDVYSFGVVMLEVASGRRPVGDDGVAIVDWVWELWGKGMLYKAIDDKLMGCFDGVEMERMLMVGLCCVHPNCEKRPTMKEAARMLRGESQLPVLPPVKPAVSIRSVSLEGSEDMQKFDEDLGGTPWSTPGTHFSKN